MSGADTAEIGEFFSSFGRVSVRRLFGGQGIYADGLCFAFLSEGEYFLKTDDVTRARFEAAGSSPFVFVMRGKPMEMSFWRLPTAAYDDADELRLWATLGLEAARRAAAGKGKGKSKTVLKPTETKIIR
ncbi:MAG: TfoX/Sxy family protein [Hyphomicrobiales bacterium]|nr:TfoX/Sxy family protein [Hyphomicrobiales bacterium]